MKVRDAIISWLHNVAYVKWSSAPSQLILPLDIQSMIIKAGNQLTPCDVESHLGQLMLIVTGCTLQVNLPGLKAHLITYKLELFS